MSEFWSQQAAIQPFNQTVSQLPDSALVALEHLAIASLTGEESHKFLQGQLTHNLELLSESRPLLAAQCDFKGKMWAIYRLLQLADKTLLLTDKEALEGALKELNKYAVFSKTDIESQSSTMTAIGVLGKDGADWLVQRFSQVPEIGNSQLVEGGTLLCLDQQRFILLLNNEQATAAIASSELPVYSHQLWQLYDIRHGVPSLAEATVNQYVPQMMNLQALDAISFTKGCYMGQEVVARTKYLGKNKRALYRLAGTADNPVTAGDELEVQLGENWRRAGIVSSAVLHDNKQLELLAVLANDSDEQQVFRVKQQAESRLTVQPLPYQLDENNE